VFHILPKAGFVHFVTDSYKTASIKQLERDRRGKTATFSIGGRLTKLPNDFKSFILNANNKQQLIRLLLCEWQCDNYAHHLYGRSVYFVCETECVCLPSDDGVMTTVTDIVSLQSEQEEADTRIILHCLFVAATSSADSTELFDLQTLTSWFCYCRMLTKFTSHCSQFTVDACSACKLCRVLMAKFACCIHRYSFSRWFWMGEYTGRPHQNCMERWWHNAADSCWHSAVE